MPTLATTLVAILAVIRAAPIRVQPDRITPVATLAVAAESVPVTPRLASGCVLPAERERRKRIFKKNRPPRLPPLHIGRPKAKRLGLPEKFTRPLNRKPIEDDFEAGGVRLETGGCFATFS